ncbi:carnosine dipeptidase 2 [Homo sapiens]|uniref:Carnosine dipeptidase 2 n=1 Tax=Homo sapiens TaxID=9606 RepID=J3QRP4_HUMAN|nr:carnosine dipeptidase 2 [Homo sapiens]KAI4046723.1 carnosine dipeptidase 2 [Homo sapiens]
MAALTTLFKYIDENQDRYIKVLSVKQYERVSLFPQYKQFLKSLTQSTRDGSVLFPISLFNCSSHRGNSQNGWLSRVCLRGRRREAKSGG